MIPRKEPAPSVWLVRHTAVAGAGRVRTTMPKGAGTGGGRHEPRSMGRTRNRAARCGERPSGQRAVSERRGAAELAGLPVVDANGGLLGTVDGLYADAQNGEASFVTIRLEVLGTFMVVAPVTVAELRRDLVVLPFESVLVVEVPVAADVAELSREDERHLYEYYGLRDPSQKGLGEDFQFGTYANEPVDGSGDPAPLPANIEDGRISFRKFSLTRGLQDHFVARPAEAGVTRDQVAPAPDERPSAEVSTEPGTRRANAWLVDTKPPLVKAREVAIGFDIGPAHDDALADVAFDEPYWGGRTSTADRRVAVGGSGVDSPRGAQAPSAANRTHRADPIRGDATRRGPLAPHLCRLPHKGRSLAPGTGGDAIGRGRPQE